MTSLFDSLTLISQKSAAENFRLSFSVGNLFEVNDLAEKWAFCGENRGSGNLGPPMKYD
jgi:hypothetical protein